MAAQIRDMVIELKNM
ncbi:hypothetical protein NKE50_05685 [Streptococcus suis]|nr:hypothetical protein [Streptococcus suis]MCO8204288.1 hypothetical protein [Streptococcus suis]MCO8204864.1 hypothetical protein [Streptococcus suis]MCO8234170.1 hypothetical protein [Streptococcus suis]